MEPRSIVGQILRIAERTPEALAVAERETITYAKLTKRILAAATWFREAKVQPGDRVVLSAPNSSSFISAYFGTHLVGAIAVPVDPRMPGPRLEEVIDEVDPSVVLVDRQFEIAGRRLEPLEECGVHQGAAQEFSEPKLDSSSDILFTTGTTSKPKGVVLTHRNIAAAAKNINTFISNTSTDREVVTVPLSHSFGLGRLRCIMMAGGMIILTDGFLFPRKIFDSIHDWAATGLSSVPAGLALLFRISGDKIGEYADQLAYLEIGSAPMPLDHKERLMRLLPKTRICMHYGLTEASRSAFIEFHTSPERLGSIGKPAPNVKIRIVGPEDTELDPGQSGTIAVQGSMVMSEYWNNSHETSNVLKDGWLYTSDLGYKDQEGYIYLQGRSADLINVGGMNVSPVEIEEALMRLDHVQDCACAAVPDPMGMSGHAVKAFIVSTSQDDSKPSQEEIVQFLRSQLEPYKIPTIFQWLDSIPRTSSGKLQRQLLPD